MTVRTPHNERIRPHLSPIQHIHRRGSDAYERLVVTESRGSMSPKVGLRRAVAPLDDRLHGQTGASRRLLLRHLEGGWEIFLGGSSWEKDSTLTYTKLT
jgi:hypothetical protein